MFINFAVFQAGLPTAQQPFVNPPVPEAAAAVGEEALCPSPVSQCHAPPTPIPNQLAPQIPQQQYYHHQQQQQPPQAIHEETIFDQPQQVHPIFLKFLSCL